jgi:16S rRNA processing protein RimM
MQLVVGRIIRPHGIRGEVVVEVTTDDPAARFAVGSELAVDSPPARAPGPTRSNAPPIEGVPRNEGVLRIEAVRPHQGRLIIAFDGIVDRDAAEELRGVRLWVDAAEVGEPEDPDEFNDFQLIGLDVVDVDGRRLGEVVRIEHGPAADLLVVRMTEGRDALVPFVRAIVPTVDVPGGRLVLTPPPGLLEL